MNTQRFLTRRAVGRLCALAGAFGLTVAVPAQAQSGGKGFLFDQPSWTLAVRGGFERANASGDIFEFVTDQLTLEKGDFSGFTAAVDLGYSLRPQLDLVFSGSYTGTKTPSEMRAFIGTDDLPIAQTTKFTRMSYTASVKGYLKPRGQSIGTLAWVPSRFAPYVGAGGGLMKYKFEQEGEFVDVDSPNLDIFRDKLTSADWTPTAHGFTGLDFALTTRLGVTAEARYSWAKGDMGNGADADFIDFGRIDLSGFSATAGLHVRF
jgi:hypothetical protein